MMPRLPGPIRGALRPAAVALLAALAFATVVPGGKFVFDDHVLLEKNHDLLRGDIWWTAFGRDYYATSDRIGGSGYYRPAAVIANAVDRRLWRNEEWGYHLTNLVLHGLASAAIAPALVALGAPVGAAWVAAALFAVHPAHAESVAFVSGRVDVLAGLGIFLALAWAASLRRAAWLGAGLASLLAFLSKEAAVVLPILLVLAWIAAPEPEDGSPRPAWVLVAVAVGTAALLGLGMRYAALGAWLPASAGGPRAAHPVLLPLQALLFSLASLFAPVRKLVLEPDPGLLPASRLVIGAVVAVALWFAAWRVDRASRPALGRCLLAGTLALVPVLDLLPQETLLSERFLYVASAFWMLPAGVLVAAAWRRGGQIRPLAAGACALVVVLLLGIAAWRARAWREDVVLWRLAVREEPDRAAFWDRLGLALTERHDYGPAEEALQRAVALDPGSFNAQLNLGVLLHTTRRPRLAVESFQQALELQPKHVNANLNLGLSYLDSGNLPAAYERFRTAASLKPDNPDALRLAGGAALQLGRLDEARRYIGEAERLQPESPAIQQLARLLAEKEKRAAGGAPPP